MRLTTAFSLLVFASPLQPDVIINNTPLTLSSNCLSSSCWIGIAHGTTLFLESPFLVPFDAHIRLSPWPLLGRASLVAINRSQLVIIDGTLSLEALDLFGTVVGDSDGGCIAARRGARLNITNSSLNGCATFGSGGALSIAQKAHAHLRDIRAVDGVALVEGGLIYAAHNASVIIDGASILSLAYATSGGLISIGPFATLDISGTTLLANGTADYIGGIISAGAGAKVTLRNAALLEYGAAQEEGGCVYAASNSMIEMQDNAMVRFCIANAHGGGIKSEGNVSLSGNTVVSDCIATFGGGTAISGASAVVEVVEAALISNCLALLGGVCVVSTNLLDILASADASHSGGVASLSQARVVLRDSARITACTAVNVGGGVYGEGIITLAGDAMISHCRVSLLNTGQGGGIWSVDGAYVSLRDRAKVVDCQAQGAGGCIYAFDIVISDHAHVGNCTALNSVGVGFGGCCVASSRIVVTDFATLTQCHADFGSAFSFLPFGTLFLSGNVVVSDCSAVTSGAVAVGADHTTVVLQDNVTISRAYSESFGTFYLKGASASFVMTGRASIQACVASSGSAVNADKASVAIHGQNKIVNCSGSACSEPVSSRVAEYRRTKNQAS